MMLEKIAERAEEDIGKTRYEVGCSGDHAWCANWVSEVLKSIGIDMYDWSCTSMQKKMSDSDEWDEPETEPVRGDIIFFDWDRDIHEAKPLDHVGIVLSKYGDTITYANGNGSSSTRVTKQTISFTSQNIAYWMRYCGDTSHPPNETTFQPEERRILKKGSTGAFVKSLQQLLLMKGYAVGADDGDFGNKTLKCVENFQRDHKLEIDGIVGKQTFEELIGK